MSQITPILGPSKPTRLNVRGLIVTDEQFTQLCRENPELRLELTAQKELVIMSPTGFKTGRRNSRLTRIIHERRENGRKRYKITRCEP